MPQIAISFVSEAQTASRFALNILSDYVIVQSPVNTAILKSCHDRYDNANDLSAAYRYSTDPLMEDGYVKVPEKPGLGVDLNYEGIKENLRYPGLFEPTEKWNTPKLGFWRPRPGENWE